MSVTRREEHPARCSIRSVPWPLVAAAALLLLTWSVAFAISPRAGASPTGSARMALLALQQAKLTASDRASGDALGCAVAISGDTALVGADGKTVGGQESAGAVYVFVDSGAGWQQEAEIADPSPAAGDGFGTSVALADGTAVIGAPGVVVSGKESAGAVYVFTGSGATWSQDAELTDPPAAAEDQFGDALALAGDELLIGADRGGVFGDDGGPGAAYLFSGSGASWSLQTELKASDGADGDSFGYDVAISGDTAVVGACNRTVAGNESVGGAYVFTGSGSSWSQQGELNAADPTSDLGFGSSVALSGDTVLVGSPATWVGAQVQEGVAYVFTRTGTTWSRQAELKAAGAVQADHVGWSVALSGDKALIGAAGSSRAYVFTDTGSRWVQEADITPAKLGGGNWFGSAVALEGATALIGADSAGFTATDTAGCAYIDTLVAAPSLTLKASARSVKVGRRVTLRGNVRNTVAADTMVTISRKSGHKLVTLKKLNISGSGGFRWTMRVKTPGKLVLIASYKAGGVTFKSKTVTVTVRR